MKAMHHPIGNNLGAKNRLQEGKMTKKIFILLFASSFFLSSQGSSSSREKLSIDQLVTEADEIIRGKIITKKVYQENETKNFITSYEVLVLNKYLNRQQSVREKISKPTKQLSNRLDSTQDFERIIENQIFILTMPGGRTVNGGDIIAGLPEFVINDDVFLFVKMNSQFPIVGFNQGAFLIKEIAGKNIAHNYRGEPINYDYASGKFSSIDKNGSNTFLAIDELESLVNEKIIVNRRKSGD